VSNRLISLLENVGVVSFVKMCDFEMTPNNLLVAKCLLVTVVIA